nr:type II secretion system minor pseudopilin GspK [Hyphomonas sp. Mor2]
MTTRRTSERGAALLTVMMIVAAMSVAAVAVTQAVTQSTVRSRALDAQAQLAFYAASAEEVAKARLTEVLSPLESKLVLGMPGLGEPQFIPIDNGAIAVTVRDSTNCFNVNQLTVLGEGGGLVADPPKVEAYTTLLNSLIEEGFSSDMVALSSSLVDWMDDDNVPRNGGAEDSFYSSETPSYRTSGQKLASLDELRSIRGYTTEIFARVRPVLCALPNDAPDQVLNINTLEIHHAPLLQQVFTEALSVEDARELIASRPKTGWTAIEDLTQDPLVKNIDPTLVRADRLGLVTSLVEVSTNVSYRGSDMTMLYLFEAKPGRPIRTLRRERIG